MELALLEKTRDVFAERGHAAGVLMDVEGHVCLYGALYLAAGFAVSPSTIVLPQLDTEDFAHDLGFTSSTEVCRFNNARCEQDVLARLDYAIRAKRAGEQIPVEKPLTIPSSWFVESKLIEAKRELADAKAILEELSRS